MSKRLEKIESKIQKIIEGAGKLFSTGSAVESLTEKLIQCMRENVTADDSGILSAPARYLVEVNPSELSGADYEHTRLDQLTSDLVAAATGDGILLNTRPEIIVNGNPSVQKGDFLVSVHAADHKPGNTAAVNILEEPEPLPSLPEGAFLIVNGSETVQLRKAVINIGRRSTNDIILDDPRVSRDHAQIRLIKDRYVVFDLNSSGGTFINNLPINQKELSPGDVISLAGVSIIFGCDFGGVLYDQEERTPTNQLVSKKPGEKK